MTVASKHFNVEWLPLANAISNLDVDQVTREKVAQATTEALNGRRWFMPDTFRLLASDPIVPCIGTGGSPCPTEAWSRIPMHYSGAPDGRSAAWSATKPAWRCVECGAREFGGLR